MSDNRGSGADVAFLDFMKQQVSFKSPLEVLRDEAKKVRQGINGVVDKAEYGIGYAIGSVGKAVPVDTSKAKGFLKEATSWLGGKKFQDKLIEGVEKKSPRVASVLRSFQKLDQKLAQRVRSIISRDKANIDRGIQAARSNTH